MQCNVASYFACVCILMLCSTTYATVHGNQERIYKRFGYCGLQNFQCDSGQCINEEYLCDGIPDCADNSDETVAACTDIQCPKFIYRCNYGACVNARAKCNGIRDCLDGSDEASCGVVPTTTTVSTPFTTRKRPTLSRPLRPVNCLIPNDPDNGIYTIGGRPPDAVQTGNAVPPYSVLVTNCNTGYQTSPSDRMYSVCANGIWSPLPSTCSHFSQPSNIAKPIQCKCYC